MAEDNSKKDSKPKKVGTTTWVPPPMPKKTGLPVMMPKKTGVSSTIKESKKKEKEPEDDTESTSTSTSTSTIVYPKPEKLVEMREFLDDKNGPLYRKFSYKDKIFENYNDTTKKGLKPHQLFVINYLNPETPYKGLLAFHEVGSGKTFTGIGTIIKNYEIGIKTFILLPASLKDTWNNEITKFYKEVLDTPVVPEDLLNYIKFISYNVPYSNIESELKDLKNNFLVVDESHTFISYMVKRINKKAELYKLLMNPNYRPKKILFLSGTPLINTPFEMAKTFQILSGNENLIKEDVSSLFKITYNNEKVDVSVNNTIFTSIALQIGNMISFYKPKRDASYPTCISDINSTIECTMSQKQNDNYITIFGAEADKALKSKNYSLKTLMFSDSSSDSTYFIHSRTASNFTYPVSLIFNNELNIKYYIINLFNELKKKCNYLINKYNDMNNEIFDEINNFSNEDSSFNDDEIFDNQISIIEDLYEFLSNYTTENFHDDRFKDSNKEPLEEIEEQPEEDILEEDILKEEVEETIIVKEEVEEEVEEVEKPSNIDKFNKLDEKDKIIKIIMNLSEYIMDIKYKYMGEHVKVSINNKLILNLATEILLLDCNVVDKIKEYSTKFDRIFNTILDDQNVHQKHFIYSSFVNKSGINLLAKLLELKGYSKYNVDSPNSGKDYKRYILLSGETEKDLRSAYISKFNQKVNANGKHISIVIGSGVIAEGMTFNCVRHVHILEPYWNPSRIAQVIGRVDRYKSHEYLDEADRNYKIYKYMSLQINGKESVDHIIKNISDKKDLILDTCYNIYKSNAIDYENVIDNSKEINIIDIRSFVVEKTGTLDTNLFIIPNTIMVHKNVIKIITINGKKFIYKDMSYFIKYLDDTNTPIKINVKYNGKTYEIIPLYDFNNISRGQDCDKVVAGMFSCDSKFKIINVTLFTII